MADQLDLFEAPSALPDGFKYGPDLITSAAEQTLIAAIRELPLKEFEFHGFVGKRRTVSFGVAYDFAHERLQPAGDMPEFLLQLRNAAATFAGLPEDKLRQVLVTEYGVQTGIEWHPDKAVFGEVIGISLLSSCRFSLRRRVGGKWDRVSLEAAPRSAYLLSGPARTEWEHSMPAVETPRYSITYHTLR